ncbi:RraA family protein [Acrocarpospora macrocephala]|uniref:Putative 4-hydroxy-4-methyl-2-oxoglutarate aldolase n=1 Tax=Acrocarpospora macrocephala TaxID=150177 RepID=A0A5M3X7T6_9ACTN|nr:methyltransferase [Acrocarpospora macrocephala]GES16726.1 methyltransferase [Acrocarpospora macrocephala]
MADFPRAPQALLDRFRTIPTANIGDAVDRLGVLDGGIQAVWPGARLIGSAYTIWTRAGDNLAIHQALGEARPGDVLVVNGGGDLSRALIGELIGGRAKAAGIAGFVIDGVVRDAEGLAAFQMPVFARGVSPAGPYKNGPARLATVVAVGGVAVAPGDIVVGDADGVVVVPLADAEHVATAAEAVRDHEDVKRAAIAQSLAKSGSA